MQPFDQSAVTADLASGHEAEDTSSLAVVFDRVSFAFDDHVVLRDVSFRIPRGSMRILLGPSGSGKSVLLKLILGLLRPDSGTISVNGQQLTGMSEADLMRVRTSIGMVFQENALFDSLSVGDNVGYRLYEETATPRDVVRRRVEEVLAFIGLDSSYINSFAVRVVRWSTSSRRHCPGDGLQA